MNFTFLEKLRPFLATLLACALLNACTTTRTLAPVELVQLANVVKAGDTVDCTLRDGSHAKFKVTEVAPDALIGAAQRVPVADIAHVDITSLSAGKTTLAVVGGLVLVAAVAVAISFSGGNWMGSPSFGP